MTNDAIAVLKCIFQTIWKLFTNWHIPGTNVSPAEWCLFCLVAGIGLRLFFGLVEGIAGVSLPLHHNDPQPDSDPRFNMDGIPRSRLESPRYRGGGPPDYRTPIGSSRSFTARK